MVTKNQNPKSDKPAPTRRPRPASVKGAPGETVTPVQTWKKRVTEGTLLTVPSGNTALVRAPGMQAFLKEGVIPNGLKSIIQDAMVTGLAPGADVQQSMLDDPEKLQQIMDLVDAVTVACCLDPVVVPVPHDLNGEVLGFNHPDRDENTLYVDEVDFNDKLFIFNFAVGGTADLEKFRSES